MKNRVVIAVSLAVFGNIAVAGDVYVDPVVKKDGTFVEGHYRTAPNSTRIDNYSTKGNTNPYTGKAGTLPIQKPIKIK